jgi:uncharacterized protein YjlB
MFGLQSGAYDLQINRAVLSHTHTHTHTHMMIIMMGKTEAQHMLDGNDGHNRSTTHTHA